MRMLGKKNETEFRRSGEVNAFLGRGTTLQGRLIFEGILRIDGKCDGDILSGDSLVIGNTGEVDAQINVSDLVVNGKAKGKITAKNRVEITSSGEIRGDIETSVLVVSEGAIFEGNCKMEKRQTGLDERVSFLKPKEGETVQKEEGKMDTNQVSNKPGAKNDDASRYSQRLNKSHGPADEIL
jgi:cytoskeletal protein CcmA (bactofilin family)